MVWVPKSKKKTKSIDERKRDSSVNKHDEGNGVWHECAFNRCTHEAEAGGFQ